MSPNRIRVALAYPSDGLCYKFARAKTRRMPLGLAYIGAALVKAGYETSVVDGSLYDLTNVQVAERLLQVEPHFVGIGCTTPLYHQAVAIAALIKERSPETVVIMGGPHVSALPEATLDSSAADFVCIGEGEASVVGIIEHVLAGKDPAGVPGIAYNWRGYRGITKPYRIRSTQNKSETIKGIDLDEIPIPDRTLFDWKRYSDPARGCDQTQTLAMLSRGCPGKCVFCGAANTLVRFRHLDNILDELAQIQAMGIREVFVTDDTYTTGKKRILALRDGLKQRGIHLKFSVQLRLDQLDREMCDALYESGVRYVGPGIESGNEKIMRQIGKGPKETKNFIRKQIQLLKEYDWTIRNSYVMGMPEETEAQIMETIAFAKELGADENAFSIVVPYPGSPLWHTARSRNLVHERMDFSKFLYYHEIGCNMSAVPTERLLELHELAYEYVGNKSYKLKDGSVSSGDRPFIPYPSREMDQAACGQITENVCLSDRMDRHSS